MAPELNSHALSRLCAGSTGRVVGVGTHAQALRVREMGLCEGQQVEVLCAEADSEREDGAAGAVGDLRVGRLLLDRHDA